MYSADQDIQALCAGERINDNIINDYLYLIQQRGTRTGQPRVYSFNTNFLEALLKRGYIGVASWTKKRDIFRFDQLLFPYFEAEIEHWVLVVTDLRKKVVHCFDSLHRDQTTVAEKILEYLGAEAFHRQKSVFHRRKWRVCQKLGPRQYTKTDCGVFVCLTAEAYAVDRRISFTQTDIKRLRAVMAEEICEGKLKDHASPLLSIPGVHVPPPRNQDLTVERAPSPLLSALNQPGPSRTRSPSPPRKPKIRMDAPPPPELEVRRSSFSSDSSSSDTGHHSRQVMTLYSENNEMVELESPPTLDEVLEDWDTLSIDGYLDLSTTPRDPDWALECPSLPPSPVVVMETEEAVVTRSQPPIDAVIPAASPDPELQPENTRGQPEEAEVLDDPEPPKKKRKPRQRKYRQRTEEGVVRTLKSPNQ